MARSTKPKTVSALNGRDPQIVALRARFCRLRFKALVKALEAVRLLADQQEPDHAHGTFKDMVHFHYEVQIGVSLEKLERIDRRLAKLWPAWKRQSRQQFMSLPSVEEFQ